MPKITEKINSLFRRNKNRRLGLLSIGELEIITNEFWAKNPFDNKNAIISKLMEGNR